MRVNLFKIILLHLFKCTLPAVFLIPWLSQTAFSGESWITRESRYLRVLQQSQREYYNAVRAQPSMPAAERQQLWDQKKKAIRQAHVEEATEVDQRTKQSAVGLYLKLARAEPENAGGASSKKSAAPTRGDSSGGDSGESDSEERVPAATRRPSINSENSRTSGSQNTAAQPTQREPIESGGAQPIQFGRPLSPRK